MTDGLVYSCSYPEGSREEGVCRICGRAGSLTETPRLYCCRKHQRRAKNARRHPGYQGPKFSGEGVCLHCGKTFRPSPRFRPTCGDPACWEAMGDRGFWRFRQAVKWPHPLSWLAAKLKLDPDDPRLPEVARALAAKGLLVVYIRADGTVGEVGRPKAETRGETQPGSVQG